MQKNFLKFSKKEIMRRTKIKKQGLKTAFCLSFYFVLFNTFIKNPHFYPQFCMFLAVFCCFKPKISRKIALKLQNVYNEEL